MASHFSRQTAQLLPRHVGHGSSRKPKSEPGPRFTETMQCTRIEMLPEGEVGVRAQADGYRVIGLVDGNSAMLYSMSGSDHSDEFAHITFSLRNLGADSLVPDG